MNYIAMDCHISTLEFAVVNEGDRVTKEYLLKSKDLRSF